ncbi:helix-turn-helix transcriptional regulator [Streptomyces lasiicapitis]|uniref:helix-turn-helix transcriptional regulator n=1 Tax=Streptomyces lasiicapitis TaxID=1923961 RepID=UPI0036997808
MVAHESTPRGGAADEEIPSTEATAQHTADDGTAATGTVPEAHTGHLAGEFMGLGAMLKRWRKTAGVTQARAARALEVSERTYRNIEGGATPRFSQEQCDALAELLALEPDERHALLLHNVGTYLRTTPADGAPEVGPALRLLIDRQMPSPTYLSDRNWNILAYNRSMAEMWPWVMEPDANLIRWALTTAEGRATYHDWHMHATVFVRMLRFALTTHGGDPDLARLIEDVKKNPEVRQIWESGETKMVEHRDGHVFLASIPTLDFRTIEIVSHVAYPAIMPDTRFVVMTWVDAGPDAQRDALGGPRNGWVDETHGAKQGVRAQDRLAEADRQRTRCSDTARRVVTSAEQAAALAGEDALPLPALSARLGPDTQLTLSSTTRMVTWAVEDGPHQWGVTEVTPIMVLARVPWPDLDDQARVEMKAMMYAGLPIEPADALGVLDHYLSEADEQVSLLRELRAEMAAEHDLDRALSTA